MAQQQSSTVEIVTMPRTIYRCGTGDGWTYLLSQEHYGRTILEVIEGRSPVAGSTHLYVQEDGRLTNILGGEFDSPLTTAGLIDTGFTWDSLESREGYRRWQKYLCEYRPSRPLHFGCDHQDAPCQVRGPEHRPCPEYWRYLCQQCQETTP